MHDMNIAQTGLIAFSLAAGTLAPATASAADMPKKLEAFARSYAVNPEATRDYHQTGATDAIRVTCLGDDAGTHIIDLDESLPHYAPAHGRKQPARTRVTGPKAALSVKEAFDSLQNQEDWKALLDPKTGELQPGCNISEELPVSKDKIRKALIWVGKLGDPDGHSIVLFKR